MKKKYIFLLALIVMMMAMPAVAQEMPDNLWQPEDANSRGCEYVANEVIVKFKHSSPVRIKRNEKTRRFISSNVTNVDMVLDSLGLMNIDDLMPLTGAQVSKKQLSVRGVRLAPDQNLSKLCNITFDTSKVKTVDDAIMMLERLPEVEYAEPNYIVHIMSSSASDTIYIHTDSATYTAEPLYSQQWGLPKINLPWLWKQPKSKKRPVIAILDTGVEIDHPDLVGNIWSNEAEVNGVGGQDDDGNGFFDDIHGYDFVNSTGVIGDRNGHGTHCAGIAAAVANNGIGITGANPDALIMPIQVMDRTGSGSMSNIIKGIDYANANGADILSMSIGGKCYSQAEEEALLKAFYNGKYLVAAAGNESSDIYWVDDICVRKHCFPGAYKFVMGVMSTDLSGEKSVFSNYDSDGPYYTEYDNEGPAFFGDYYNYDIAAPGSDILSTFLNGTYTYMGGTSMSTPLVAGALSRLLQCRTFYSQESCQGLLIQMRDTVSYNNIDVKVAMEFDEFDVDPVLIVSHYDIVDTICGGNGDGIINPGEIIEIYPIVRCIYGIATDISVRINHGLNVDTTTFEIIQNNASVGYSLSPGASVRCKTPIIAKVAERCGDGYTIQLFPTIHLDSMPTVNMASAYAHKMVLTIEDVVNINGIVDSVMTLYPNKKYVLTGSFVLNENAVLNILPGTKIVLKAPFVFDLRMGRINAKGTPDSLITFTAPHYFMPPHDICRMVFPIQDTLEYVQFENINYQPIGISEANFKNCIIHNNINSYGCMDFVQSCFERCNIISSSVAFNGIKLYDTNIVDNAISAYRAPWGINPWWHDGSFIYGCNVYSNFAIEERLGKGELPIIGTFFADETAKQDFVQFKMDDPSYFGTYDKEEIEKGLWDVNDVVLREMGCLGEFIIDNRLAEPSRSAHAIVWKVLINDEELEPYKTTSTPLGVGTHKFQIYYSQPMDTSIYPTISFGIRQPYIQNIVADSVSWSVDGKILTAYCTIAARTMTDGINYMLIEGGRDTDLFPMPIDKARFQFIVQVMGSLSTGLIAEPGWGKITLQWHTDEEDFEDLMGYHIYRWHEVEDSVFVEYDENWNWIGEWQYFMRMDTTIVNDILLTPEEVEFVDYNVTPGIDYYYQIKQITTSFSKYDFSNPVVATPYTSTKGDANGSFSVDVADVVTIVGWFTGQNPQPFIFEAADVNADGVVNILDVVATINIIMNPSSAGIMSVDNTATYYIENGILYVETTVALGGVQFSFVADKDAEIKPLVALDGFEKVTNWINDHELLFMAYSMSGKTIPAGRHALLEIGDAELSSIVLSDTQGHNVLPINGTTTNLGVVEQMQLFAPYPNPFREQVVVPYLIGQSGEHAVRMVFTDVAGRTIDVYTTTNDFGSYSYTWTPTEGMLPGVYFVSLYVDNKLMQTSKIVYIQ